MLLLGRSRDRWPWARVGHSTANERLRRGLAAHIEVMDDRQGPLAARAPAVSLGAMVGALCVLAAGSGLAWLHEVNFELIQRAASLSRQLDMAVLVAEVTDDDYAMAVMAERGALRYLRFRTELQDQGAGATLAEVTYSPDAGIGIDAAPDDAIHGLAQRAIRDLFRVEGADLDKYCQQRPPGNADESYGLFTRLRRAPPRLSLAARLLAPLRHAGSFLTIPFILVGTVLIALVYSARPGKEPVLTVWRLFLLGFAALAVPVALLVLILRALFG